MGAMSPQNFDWKVYSEKIKLVDAAKAWIWKWGMGSSGFLIIVWPAICLPWGVFPKAVYNLWASIAFMWGWVASMMIVSLPIWENRKTIMAVLTCSPIKNEAKKGEVEVAGA